MMTFVANGKTPMFGAIAVACVVAVVGFVFYSRSDKVMKPKYENAQQEAVVSYVKENLHALYEEAEIPVAKLMDSVDFTKKLITLEEPAATEEEVAHWMEENGHLMTDVIREITDRGIQNGDYVYATMTAYTGTKAAPEGDRSGEFNFEVSDPVVESMVGHMAGESYSVDVQYPADFYLPEYAGKEFRYEVYIECVMEKNGVRYLTQEDAVAMGYESLDAYLDTFRAEYIQQRESVRIAELEEKVKELFMDNVLDEDIPEGLVEKVTDMVREDILGRYNATIYKSVDDYLMDVYGFDQEGLEKMLKESGVFYAKRYMIAAWLLKAENTPFSIPYEQIADYVIERYNVRHNIDYNNDPKEILGMENLKDEVIYSASEVIYQMVFAQVRYVAKLENQN